MKKVKVENRLALTKDTVTVLVNAEKRDIFISITVGCPTSTELSCYNTRTCCC